jgi:hypothetical protein
MSGLKVISIFHVKTVYKEFIEIYTNCQSDWKSTLETGWYMRFPPEREFRQVVPIDDEPAATDGKIDVLRKDE